MLKNILKIKGAQELSKSAQNSINGGDPSLCPDYKPVPAGHGVCRINNCWVVYHCDDLCPDGTDPICRVGDY